ncbi:hypothetical protein DJ013_12210 [Arcticibacterium luteifluviistationis]|uniref:Ig-like domain-containing protein n=2 Tax=Arcticibacterium luteifluviistationis TaxID=1784714 RepID=A0A2Z4GCY8_9BACT|nr:hypothetical protein DJ013_12210 [Arcticibacterium luteifluviistationis]
MAVFFEAKAEEWHSQLKNDVCFINCEVLKDTSSMEYYSFKHQKAIKFEEFLNESNVSYINTCVGRSLILSLLDYGEGADYTWEGPHGFKSKSAAVKFEKVQLNDDGIYTVNVVKGGEVVQGRIKLIVKPMPEAKINNGVFNENEAIQLQAEDNLLDAKYEWRNVDKKVISKSKDLWISPKKEGKYTYRLTVNKDGCEVSKDVEISVGIGPYKRSYNSVVDVLRLPNK